MPAIINSDSGVITGSAGLKIHGNSDGILEIQNNGVTSLVVANSYIRVPVGNTATRPSVASAGMLRFNNQSNVFEAYNGIEWANISSPYVPPTYTLEYLVVAGGGGGGTSSGSGGAGGGGAGGLLTSNLSVNTFPIVYTVTVGAGGSADTIGSNSSIISQQGPNVSITSFGGGRGGGQPNLNAGSGGSGGGASASGSPGSGTPGQGNTGGPSNLYTGGGGGGASQAGFIGAGDNRATGGKGGDGRPSLITGANVIYAGGGGGGCNSDGSVPRSVGGAGGGGYGSGFPTEVGGSGNVNLGGGGGAGSRSPQTSGGTGGAGVVIIAHSNTLSNGIVSAGLTFTTNTTSRPGFIVYSFTAGTGTISWN